MKFVDTNILVRLIMHDEPAQVRQAETILATALPGEYVVLDAVVDEVCTVLGLNHLYGMPRQLIYESVEQLLSRPVFQVSTAARTALNVFQKNPKLDFVDCLLLTLSGGQKDDVLTFDKDLIKALGP